MVVTSTLYIPEQFVVDIEAGKVVKIPARTSIYSTEYEFPLPERTTWWAMFVAWVWGK